MRQRMVDLIRFYELLARMEERIGARPTLADCDSRTKLPERGVYFFMEQNEKRSDTGVGPRIVRVGTHGLKLDSKATLWNRLSQHKGSAGSGGGNHRGSIFRLLIGSTLAGASAEGSRWGQGSTAAGEIRRFEAPLEQEVSDIIRGMSFLWLSVDDAAHPESARGVVERNAIALLSNYGKQPLDAPSEHWRGRKCDREKVRMSGLWNNRHVDEDYDPAFLDTMESLVERM
jgi:hypothetical protein